MKKNGKNSFIWILACVFAAAGIVLILLAVRKGKPETEKKGSAVAEAGPEALKSPLYKSLSALNFSAADGSPAEFAEKKCRVILYWASWCPDCESVLPSVDHLAAVSEEEGARFDLVDRTEKGKETAAGAEAALKKAGVKSGTLFDFNRKAYDALQLSELPSLLVADAAGTVTAVSAGKMPEDTVLRSMIGEAEKGKAKTLYDFICQNMLNGENGVIHEFSNASGNASSGKDVLAESQGLLMLYGEKDRFDQLYDFVKTHSCGGGLAAWQVEEQKTADVNAVIDDLRIVRALRQNGNYEKELSAYVDSLYRYNCQDRRLVDFYDFKQKRKADRLTLCYADFEAMDALSNLAPAFSEVRENALKTVTGGYISDAFPLYRSWYDYGRKVYPHSKLNMSEALLTLLHLSRIGKLPASSLTWLKKRMGEGHIWAVYDEDGNAVKRYDSSAVYALTALIAVSEQDRDLASAAIEKMDRLKIRNAGSEVNGAFGNPDGSGITSFDQLLPLLAYRTMDQAPGTRK